MNKNTIFFGDVIRIVAQTIRESGLNPEKVLVVRDIYGKIRLILNESSSSINEQLSSKLSDLGNYLDHEKPILFRDDLFDFDAVFRDPTILNVNLPEVEISFRLLDRQIVGQDWLRPQMKNEGNQIPRLVFYGFKGGVGRSTALVMLAWTLARKGKRVLLLDLDLESPGLSGLLLPPERLADFGIVDWLVEDAVGQSGLVLPRLCTSSPLSEVGDIRIAAAFGTNSKEQYLAKLSRVFADVSHEGKIEMFADRVLRLVRALEDQEKPDIVLIDSRAGLHDLAAISLVRLASTAFLFATDHAQSWQGYELLFSHWRAYPEILRSIRNRLSIVQALFPESDQQFRAKSFLEKSFKLFSENLYDEIQPGMTEEVFSYDMKDESAPHFPSVIRWNNRFQEFDPLLLDQGIFTEEDVRLIFGPFIDRAMEITNSE